MNDVALPNFLYQDEKFVSWYDQQKVVENLTFANFINTCQNKFGLDLIGGNESSCEKVISKYFDETGVQIVFDEGMPSVESPSRAYSNYNSWYIRDRSCIENVGGLPEDALNLMANDIYWKL